MRQWLLAALLLLGQAACNNAGFSGNSASPKKGDDATPQDDGEDGPDGPDGPDLGEPGDPDGGGEPGGKFDVPDDCTSDGVTNAKLLTETVKNDSPQWIEYQIFVTDCEGKVKNVSSDLILFDINSVTTGGVVGVPFEVQTPKRKELASGFMETVTGKDLFGVETPTHFHYRTDKRVEFELETKSFVFRVKSGNGRNIAVENSQDATLMIGDQNIETYLRFGEAKAVTKVVRFVDP